MAKWEGLPGHRARWIEPRRKPSMRRYLFGASLVGFLAVLAFLIELSSGGDAAKPRATPIPTSRPVAAPVPTSVPTASATPAPTATVVPSATPPRTLVVANTGGEGAFIRRSTALTDRIKAWPDRTLMVGVGETRVVDGRMWVNVRDPDGNVGWMPADFLAEAPRPTPTATRTVRL